MPSEYFTQTQDEFLKHLAVLTENLFSRVARRQVGEALITAAIDILIQDARVNPADVRDFVDRALRFNLDPANKPV